METANDPALVRGTADEAKALALQLVPEPEDSRNRYFREGARTILRAVMLHLATRGAPEICTLPEMWRVLSSTRRIEKVVEEMIASDALVHVENLLLPFSRNGTEVDRVLASVEAISYEGAFALDNLGTSPHASSTGVLTAMIAAE